MSLEAETILYVIVGVVILTLIAFCFACYYTCREMRMKPSSPSGSSDSPPFWTGNPNTVLTVHPPRVWRTAASQRFRQISWRTLMQRSRTNTVSSCNFPLISVNRASFDNASGPPSVITVVYERNRRSQGVPMNDLFSQPPSDLSSSFPNIHNVLNCTHSEDTSPPPAYDDVVKENPPMENKM